MDARPVVIRRVFVVKSVGLTANETKTEAVKFRRGGRISAGDQLHFGGKPLEFVNAFRYLGVIIAPNGGSFSAERY